jgi:integrase/recombinase XerD
VTPSNTASPYAGIAAGQCPSIGEKKVTANVLRHTAAMRLLEAGVDTSVIAVWLGHESIETTRIYLFADLDLKERALDRTRPLSSPPGPIPTPDDILAWLDAL